MTYTALQYKSIREATAERVSYKIKFDQLDYPERERVVDALVRLTGDMNAAGARWGNSWKGTPEERAPLREKFAHLGSHVYCIKQYIIGDYPYLPNRHTRTGHY